MAGPGLAGHGRQGWRYTLRDRLTSGVARSPSAVSASPPSVSRHGARVGHCLSPPGLTGRSVAPASAGTQGRRQLAGGRERARRQDRSRPRGLSEPHNRPATRRTGRYGPATGPQRTPGTGGAGRSSGTGSPTLRVTISPPHACSRRFLLAVRLSRRFRPPLRSMPTRPGCHGRPTGRGSGVATRQGRCASLREPATPAGPWTGSRCRGRSWCQ